MGVEISETRSTGRSREPKQTLNCLRFWDDDRRLRVKQYLDSTANRSFERPVTGDQRTIVLHIFGST